jgi:DNA polymerase-3 subunit gamma/tau
MVSSVEAAGARHARPGPFPCALSGSALRGPPARSAPAAGPAGPRAGPPAAAAPPPSGRPPCPQPPTAGAREGLPRPAAAGRARHRLRAAGSACPAARPPARPRRGPWRALRLRPTGRPPAGPSGSVPAPEALRAASRLQPPAPRLRGGRRLAYRAAGPPPSWGRSPQHSRRMPRRAAPPCRRRPRPPWQHKLRRNTTCSSGAGRVLASLPRGRRCTARKKKLH